MHDVESPDLVDLGEAGRTPLRVNPLLLETDLVLCVTAAETVLHGGPGALLGACGPEALRAGDGVLAARDRRRARLGARRRTRAAAVRARPADRRVARPQPDAARRPLPRLPLRGRRRSRHLARSPLRRFSLLPSSVRRRLLQDLARELTAVAAFAGPPSVAHAEALLRGIAHRAVPLERPLDAIVVGMPWKHHHSPRERLNPITVAAVALGLALRLWRDAFPVADGGTAIVLHRFSRHFAHGTQDPYRALFHSLRDGRTADDLAAGEREAREDARALEAYRAGRACHPLLPYLDWESCRPSLDRLGAVVIAGCRDHQAARTLGFVPTHGVTSALEMAHGRAGGQARIGFLLGPPYFPLEVGAGT